MSIDSPEYKNYDVQYSIRLPQDLADEINARAEHDGVKPSTWIRNSLVKIIQNRDAENADSIKTAVMYLLTADKDVQKQIRLLTGEIRENGSRMSKVESTLTEFTALSDQEIILQRKMNESDCDIADLTQKLGALSLKLRDIDEKKEHLQVAFRDSDNSKNLRFILADFETEERKIRTETVRVKELLEEKRKRMLEYKMFLSDLSVRKKQLLSKYNSELSMNRSSVKNLDESAAYQDEADEYLKELNEKRTKERMRMRAVELRRRREEELQKKSGRKSVKESDVI